MGGCASGWWVGIQMKLATLPDYCCISHSTLHCVAFRLATTLNTRLMLYKGGCIEICNTRNGSDSGSVAIGTNLDPTDRIVLNCNAADC